MNHIDHVNIVVTDIEASARFYSHVFGLERGFEKMLEGPWIEEVTGIEGAEAYCVFMESTGSDVRLELLEYRTPLGDIVSENAIPSTRGIRHVAFEVDDMDALLRRLEEADVEPISPPVEVPFVVAGMGKKRLCYFHDPDGTLLEAAAYE